MKSFTKKIAILSTTAIMAIAATSITGASAVKKAMVGDCWEGCINEWEYTNYAKSHFINDEHPHRSSVKVAGSTYYSGTDSSDYVEGLTWAKASKKKKWYQSYSCHYDCKGSDCGGLWYVVSSFVN